MSSAGPTGVTRRGHRRQQSSSTLSGPFLLSSAPPRRGKHRRGQSLEQFIVNPQISLTDGLLNENVSPNQFPLSTKPGGAGGHGHARHHSLHSLIPGSMQHMPAGHLTSPHLQSPHTPIPGTPSSIYDPSTFFSPNGAGFPLGFLDANMNVPVTAGVGMSGFTPVSLPVEDFVRQPFASIAEEPIFHTGPTPIPSPARGHVRSPTAPELSSPSNQLTSSPPLPRVSVAGVELAASIENTGISADEVDSFIGEQDNATKKWQCLYPGCVLQFGRRENIRSHIQTHLGDRQFKCAVCHKSFVRVHDMKRHSVIHSGKKPYSCLCGQAFARQDALTRHLQRKTCSATNEGAKNPVRRGRPPKNRAEEEEGGGAQNSTSALEIAPPVSLPVSASTVESSPSKPQPELYPLLYQGMPMVPTVQVQSSSVPNLTSSTGPVTSTTSFPIDFSSFDTPLDTPEFSFSTLPWDPLSIPMAPDLALPQLQEGLLAPQMGLKYPYSTPPTSPDGQIEITTEGGKLVQIPTSAAEGLMKNNLQLVTPDGQSVDPSSSSQAAQPNRNMLNVPKRRVAEGEAADTSAMIRKVSKGLEGIDLDSWPRDDWA